MNPQNQRKASLQGENPAAPKHDEEQSEGGNTGGQTKVSHVQVKSRTSVLWFADLLPSQQPVT